MPPEGWKLFPALAILVAMPISYVVDARKQRVLTTSLPDIAPIVARMLKTDEPDRMLSLLEKLNA